MAARASRSSLSAASRALEPLAAWPGIALRAAQKAGGAAWQKAEGSRSAALAMKGARPTFKANFLLCMFPAPRRFGMLYSSRQDFAGGRFVQIGRAHV